MCTLSIIPLTAQSDARDDVLPRQAAMRVVCNRDESRWRAAAVPPQVRAFGRHKGMLPIDPASNGTWIAASDAGLVLVLMNVYAAGAQAIQPIAAPTSRGTIIPDLLASENLEQACRAANRLPHASFEPFRLVIADPQAFVELVWSGGIWRPGQPQAVDRPVLFTSSGLGDEVVGAPRCRLFAVCCAPGRDPLAGQDAFHRHVWPGAEFRSVWMTRAEALTVSRTEIELDSRQATMRYVARVGDTAEVVAAQPISLPIVGGRSLASSVRR